MYETSGPLTTTTARMIAVRLKGANRQIFRVLLSLASAALLVRLFGLLNQVIVTGRFGAGATMDAYFVATALPLLLAQLVASALESSVIPVYARVRAKGREQASALFSTVLNLLLLAAVLLTVLMLVFRRQMIYLSAPALDPQRTELALSLAPIIFPAFALMVVISLLVDILNTEGQFGWPAYAGLLVPLTTAVLAFTLGRSQGVLILCIGTLAGLCLQLCVVLVRARRAGLAYRFVVDLRNPAIAAILVVAWPELIGALIGQASPLVDQVFASYLSPGNIAALGYALKLVGVPIGVIFVSVGRAALPYLARQASIKDMKAFKETLRLYLWAVGIGTTVLAACMIVLAHPLVQVLFQRGAFTAEDTDRTATILVGFLIGLTPVAFGFITSRAFSALGQTRVLMGVTAFSVCANAVFDYIFARLWQGFGIALATSAVYTCTMFILLSVLRRRIGGLNLFTPPPEILNAIGRIGFGSRNGRKRPSSFGIPFRVRQTIARVGMALAVFAIGTVGVIENTAYAVRVSLGSVFVVVLLRYPYALLISWVMIDAFIGSSLQIFQGNNFETGLTVPTLLLMTCMPLKQTFRRVPALAFLLAFFLWVLVGIAMPTVSIGTFLISWLVFLDYIAVAVLTINLITTRRRLMALIDAILLLTTFISIYGIYGYVTRRFGIPDNVNPSLFRASSIFGQAPPALALYLSVIIPLAIYRTFTLQGLKRLGGCIVVLVFLLALALTFTRSAFISVPLGLVVLVLCFPSKRMRVGLIGGFAAAGALGVLLASVVNIPIFQRFFNQDITTLNGRTYLWQAVLDHFDPTNLLGNGLNAAKILLINLQVGFRGVIGDAPHNIFLGALYDQGVIGAALLALAFAVLVVNLLQGARGVTGEQRVLFGAALAAFVSVLLQSLDSSDIWNQAIGIYFMIIIALPFALYWQTIKQPPETGEQAYGEDSTEPRLPAVRPQNGSELLVPGLGG